MKLMESTSGSSLQYYRDNGGSFQHKDSSYINIYIIEIEEPLTKFIDSKPEVLDWGC